MIRAIRMHFDEPVRMTVKGKFRHHAGDEIGRRVQRIGNVKVFAFARAVGMLPLTGTSSEEHMKEDLASGDLRLAAEALRAIESLAE